MELLLVLTSLITIVSAIPLPFPATRKYVSDPRVFALTDTYLFSTTLASFLKTKSSASRDPRLDWKDDSCSSSPDRPFGFPFTDACKRHDFGYHNYLLQQRRNEPNRKKLDDLFKQDLLNNICAAIPERESRKLCEMTAELYYRAVREFGDVYVEQVHDLDGVKEVWENLLGKAKREGWVEKAKGIWNGVKKVWKSIFGR